MTTDETNCVTLYQPSLSKVLERRTKKLGAPIKNNKSAHLIKCCDCYGEIKRKLSKFRRVLR